MKPEEVIPKIMQLSDEQCREALVFLTSFFTEANKHIKDFSTDNIIFIIEQSIESAERNSR